MSFDIARRFEVTVPGRGTMRLGPSDHVASGGEGHVYRKGGNALKMWDSPDRAVSGRMTEKVRLLSELKHPWIVAPEALALDGGSCPVGYVMPWVEDAWALPMAFTNDWRSANGFGDPEAIAFAARMRDVVRFVHSRNVVMGDANDLNVLGVGTGLACEPRYIDVDPWVMPGFPGDKILPTIQDHHSAPFSVAADWFAWAVVTFQLLAGVHPYRGTHPGFARNDLIGRMKANASVFDTGVRLSPAVRPFDRIPRPLLDWYRAVFSDGFRGEAPDPAAAPARGGAVQTGSRILRGGDVTLAEVFRVRAPVLRTVAPDVLLLAGGRLVSLVDGRDYGRADPAASFARLADGTIASARTRSGAVEFGTVRSVPGADVAYKGAGLAALGTWSADNRLFAAVPDGILELQVREMGGAHRALPGRRWALNPNATFFGDGAAIYDALGARYLVAPFGQTAVAVVRARDLDGLRPVALTRRGHVAVMSLIDATGAYKRAVAVFDEAFATVSILVSDADDGALPDAVTETGIVVRVDAGGDLELDVPARGQRRIARLGGPLDGRLLAGPSGVFLGTDTAILKVTVT